MTAQLKFTVFYGPIRTKERCGAPLLGLAKSIYYFNIEAIFLILFLGGLKKRLMREGQLL